MNEALDAFRAELRAAGQPYGLWGGRIVGIGFGVLVVIQVLGMVQPKFLLQFGLLLMALCVATIAVGWGLLIVAFVRRRQWARTHAPPAPPPLDSAP